MMTETRCLSYQQSSQERAGSSLHESFMDSSNRRLLILKNMSLEYEDQSYKGIADDSPITTKRMSILPKCERYRRTAQC